VRPRQCAPVVGLDEFSYKFGWLQGTGNLFTGKNKQLIAEARYVPNRQLLSIPFRSELIHCVA
jgi:hypothetical protein